jgi:hypothetical protein
VGLLNQSGKKALDFLHWFAYGIANTTGYEAGWTRLSIVDECDGHIRGVEVLLSDGYSELASSESKGGDGEAISHGNLGSNIVDWLLECGNRNDSVWNEAESVTFSWDKTESSTLLGGDVGRVLGSVDDRDLRDKRSWIWAGLGAGSAVTQDSGRHTFGCQADGVKGLVAKAVVWWKDIWS